MDYNLHCRNRFENMIDNPVAVDKAKDVLEKNHINYFRILRLEKEYMSLDSTRGWVNIYYDMIDDKHRRPHLYYMTVEDWDNFYKVKPKPPIKPVIPPKKKSFLDKIFDSIFSIFK